MGTLVLAGRYEIEEKIGDGGMAVVYKARDRQLNRFVAIKILKKEFIADQTFVENFIREAKAAASLLHPNIVTIHDAGRDRDIYYIVMEYIEGKPLSDIISAEAPLDYKRCIRIAKQVASALSLAHRNNIIHRDVKPHNILITADGTAKITDFGIAKAVSDGTIINDSGVIMGSVHYFSPEQSRGQYVDEKSDIYSLGIVLYEMITGRVPFDADNPVTIAVMHMNDTIIPPSRLVKGVPPGLDQIVMKATAKYQSDRFGSIDEMYKALDNVNFITGIIDDPVVAGFVAPTSIKEESPGNGYSNAAEPVERRYEEPFDDFSDFDEFEPGSKPAAASRRMGLEEDYDKKEKMREGEPKKGKLDKKQKMILIIAAVAIAVVLSIPLSRAIIGLFQYEPVMVPDVVGLYVDEATDILTEKGFSVKVEIVPLPAVKHSALPEAGEEMTAITEKDLVDPQFTQADGSMFREGQVMEQDPKGGDMVKPGTEVKIKVAGAPVEVPEDDPNALGPPIEVPDLKGKTKSSAEYAIVAAGFQIGGVSYENSDQPIDTVISQSPVAGEKAPENSKIHIIISLGPKEELITVPEMRGRTAEEAQATATQLGFALTIREVDTTDPAQSGRVLEQNPAPNATVKKGGTVTVDVGAARFSVQIVNGAASISSARVGERVDISARAAAAGEVFAGWVIDSNNTALNPGGMTSPTAYFLMPNGNVKITATFTVANITVPNVVGMTEANARAQLTSFVVQAQPIDSSAADAGWVFEQSPAAGTAAPPNSVVVIKVGNGALG